MVSMGARVLVRLLCGVLVFILSGCSVDPCSQDGRHRPFKEYAYPDRKVYVYESKAIFELLEPEMVAGAEINLAPVVKYAKNHPNLMIQISSYANNASNSRASSERRDFMAEVIAAYLWSKGVTNNMRYMGYSGGKHSVSSNRVASIGAENRRVEIEFF